MIAQVKAILAATDALPEDVRMLAGLHDCLPAFETLLGLLHKLFLFALFEPNPLSRYDLPEGLLIAQLREALVVLGVLKKV